MITGLPRSGYHNNAEFTLCRDHSGHGGARADIQGLSSPAIQDLRRRAGQADGTGRSCMRARFPGGGRSCLVIRPLTTAQALSGGTARGIAGTRHGIGTRAFGKRAAVARG